MRWLIATVDLPPGVVGGVAHWVADAAAALSAADHEVVVLARSAGDTTAWDTAQPFAVRRVSGRSWGAWQGAWLGLAARSLLTPGTSVLCASWPTATWLAPLAQARGLRVVVAAHGSEITRVVAPPRGLRKLSSTVEWRPVSHFLAGRLRALGVPADRVAVAPMPLSLVAEPVPWSERSGLVCVARLTPLKGVERALHLAERLGERLVVVGDGSERRALQRLAEGREVDLRGACPRAEALQALGQARAAVLLPRPDPSGRGAEGLGLVLLEAAVRGVPSLGAPVGGVPEAVGPGLVLADADQPDLAAVRALLDDPEAGERSRAWVRENHGPAAFVRALT